MSWDTDKILGTGFYPPLDAGGAWFIHVDVRDGGIGSHIVRWD